MRSNLISRVQRSINNQCSIAQFQVSQCVPICARSGPMTPSFEFAVERWSQMWTGLNNFSPLGEASQHHVGYEVHTLLTVFMEVEDSWPLSSLIRSSNILSNEFIASGQALTAKYHIVHPFVIRGLTRTTAAEFCCPPKIVQNKHWLNFQLEELWSNTKSNKYPFSQNQRSVKIEVNKFWVEPGTPDKYVRLHPFFEFNYRIWI